MSAYPLPMTCSAFAAPSIAAGYLVEPGQWERPRSGRPDGAYALFRSDDAVVEIVTRCARVAYGLVRTDRQDVHRVHVAAGDRRAARAASSSIPPSSPGCWPRAPWARGCPGTSGSVTLRGATTVTLDRRVVDSGRAHSSRRGSLPESSVGRASSRVELSDVLKHVVGAARVADPRWAITLSGGVDCRVILSPAARHAGTCGP